MAFTYRTTTLIVCALFAATTLLAQGTEPATEPAKPSPPSDAKPPEPAPPATDNKDPKSEFKPALTPEEEAAKKLAEEAEKKQKEEQAQKEAAEAARLKAEKAEQEKSGFTKLLENSKLFTGLAASLGIGLNSIHGAGPGFGMTLDYVAYKTYGFHFSVMTGQYGTKAGTLNSGNQPFNIVADSSFGFLTFDFAATYAFPRLLGLEPAAGLGVALYQLRGSNYNFNQSLAPLILLSAYYDLLSHLQVGLITKLTLASASSIESTSTTYKLDSSSSLTTWSFILSLRYAWF